MNESTQTAREYDENDPIDRAIDAFHEIHPLAGNDPLDWPAHFIEGVRNALRASIGVMGIGASTMTFIVDPKQSIDEVLPADRRWTIANAIALVAAYRNCSSGETKDAMQSFVDYMRAALEDAAEGKDLMARVDHVDDQGYVHWKVTK
jgi:hypothetical protein